VQLVKVICTLENFLEGATAPFVPKEVPSLHGNSTRVMHFMLSWHLSMKMKIPRVTKPMRQGNTASCGSGLQIVLSVQWKLLFDNINDFSKGIPIFASPSSTDYKDYMCLLEGHLKWVSVVPITLVSSSRRYVYLSIGFGYVALIKSELRVLFEDPKFRLKTF
jgi:hypothetical protein